MNGDTGERQILIKGLVIPVDWDPAGKVRTVGILTDDEGEYEVASGGVNDQLKVHLRCEILAEAVLLNGSGTIKKVLVNAFAILDWKGSEDWVTAPGHEGNASSGL
jgi:hypothetical protein